MPLPEFLFESVTADIRQQMEGVLALTDRLTRRPLAPDVEACVSGVAEAAASVRRLIDTSVQLAAAAPQALTFNPEPLPLRAAMDEVQARWRGRADETGVTLIVSYDGPPEACAYVDRERLMQVFDGLVAEALAGARRGAIEVSLRVASAVGALELEAHVGGGAAAIDGDIERRVRGLSERFGLEVALGALVAQQIVAGLEGSLRAEPSPGGTEMVLRVTVPAAKPVAAEIPKPARPAHVLVVDDNATNRMVAQALCEMHGCTCEVAEDGLEAVETARTGRFDLILMDIRMPGMDGVAATRAIRGMTGRVGATPIVALTANVDREEEQAYLAAGMDGVIEKPMKPEQLVEALRKARSGDDASAAA
jgi:CheY-like chemotaxis protein